MLDSRTNCGKMFNIYFMRRNRYVCKVGKDNAEDYSDLMLVKIGL